MQGKQQVLAWTANITELTVEDRIWNSSTLTQYVLRSSLENKEYVYY